MVAKAQAKPAFPPKEKQQPAHQEKRKTELGVPLQMALEPACKSHDRRDGECSP
jgi:hypothetical protein